MRRWLLSADRGAVRRPAAWPAVAGITLSLMAAGCGRKGPPGPGQARIDEQGSGGWEEVRIGTDAVFSGLHFVDLDVGWIVGGSPFVPGGIVGRTEDGGRTWRYRTGLAPGGISASLNAVHAFDRLRACIAGDRGILLTFDGGASWQPVRYVRGAGSHLFGLHFIDDREGWAAGTSGVIHTNDGGMTWTRLGERSSAGGNVGGRVVHFVDSRNGWLAGQHANLWRTRDGGETWARVPVPQPEKAADHLPYFFGMTWVDAAQGWVVGEHGTILHTTDGGDTWSLQSAGTREAFLTAVQFVDRAGWIVGFLPDKARSFVWRTVDAGENWSVERRLEGEELRTLQMLDAETGWTVGDRVRTQPQRMLLRSRRPDR
ncbi:MAG: YCF48-related protein [Thermoanaerobaculia bacterium]|nr:YCF48-related protein [Thermoanaerobaculia bacterium]